MPAQCWEPGTPYTYGDIVEYQGHRYKIIQAHTSQSDWAPGPATAALWGRMSDDDNNCGEGRQQQQECPPQQQQQNYQPPQQQQPQQQQPQYDQHQQDHKSDDDMKKKLEIGAGLLGGAALLAGGLFAHKKHEEHKEDAKADGWARGNWISEATQRTEAYHSNGSNDACLWVLTKGTHIPKGAILVGREHSWNLYICRAFNDGGIQLGKASEAFKEGGVLGYKNKEIQVDEFEVLIGDLNRLHWVNASGRLNIASLGYRPVEAGRENDGTPLYIAKAPHKDAVHPGKVSEKLDGAYIPYDGREVHVREYSVLCYNN